MNSTVFKEIFSKYQVNDQRKSYFQIFNSFVPFLLIWFLMYLSLDVSYLLTLLIAFPAAGLLVRIFIIQHDCGHGSFLSTKKANNRVGVACSLFTWTPYFYWRKGHGIHHAFAGNLEHRGIGDVYTMTVKEYMSKTPWGRTKYRLYRNPLFLFVIIPSVIFLLWYRFPTSSDKAMKKEEASVYWTDLALVILVGSMIYLVGLSAFLMIQLPLVIISTSLGQWLFYVQHQFEDTYWENKDEWNYASAALQGSSYYKLPAVLQWFTGNIGFHHIHHLNPSIPNYKLALCHKENPELRQVHVLTIKESLNTISLRLWDEDRKKLISFKELKNPEHHSLVKT